MRHCRACGNPAPDGRSYCDWTCYLDGVGPEDTPLRVFRRQTGISVSALAIKAELPQNTATHYAMGYPVGGSYGLRAIKLANLMAEELEALGLPADRFEILKSLLMGTRDPKPQSEPDDDTQLSLIGD